jgi:hypothetical protein
MIGKPALIPILNGPQEANYGRSKLKKFKKLKGASTTWLSHAEGRPA